MSIFFSIFIYCIADLFLEMTHNTILLLFLEKL